MTASGTTPLQLVDVAAAQAFWQAHKQSHGLGDSLTNVGAFQFGDSHELADELADLVVNGPKRATCGPIAEIETAGDPLPAVGDYWIVCDGGGRPVAVVRTTGVRVGPLSSVDDQFAWDEGEGDRSRAFWLDAHTKAFTRIFTAMDRADEMHPDVEVVFERFELL